MSNPLSAALDMSAAISFFSPRPRFSATTPSPFLGSRLQRQSESGTVLCKSSRWKKLEAPIETASFTLVPFSGRNEQISCFGLPNKRRYCAPNNRQRVLFDTSTSSFDRLISENNSICSRLAPSTCRWLEYGRSSNACSSLSLRLIQRCSWKPMVLCEMGVTPRMGEMIVGQKKFAVFVSGGGSNLRAINEALEDGSLTGKVVVVVTDKYDCGGAQYAIERGIHVVLFPKSSKVPNGFSPFDLVSLLREYEVDFILLAGFLKLIPVELVRAYPKSILNIHPSLLPAFGGKGFYGLKVHNAVIASGARYSGSTIYFVDECYDTGKILAQKVVPVFADDSAKKLAARVLYEEHKLYVEVVAALCEDRIVWRDDGVPLIQKKIAQYFEKVLFKNTLTLSIKNIVK